MVPWITESVGAGHELIALGASMGAYHAVHFAFQRADLAPLAIGLSGNYDVGTWHAWGERGDATYFANPTDYVPGLPGDHLDVAAGAAVGAARRRAGGVGGPADRSAAVDPARFAALLQDKGIRYELDVWGHDSATTGRGGSASSPTTCRGSLRRPHDHSRDVPGAPDRAAARRRGGLADGLRGAGPPARRDPRRPGREHTAAHRAGDHRAVQPARHGPARAGHRPAGVLVLPPARVAEEGRADGRRLPAQLAVHVPVDGEALGVLRDDPARDEGPRDGAGALQEPGRQRPLGLHVGEVQPRRSTSTRVADDAGLPAVHEAVRRRRLARGVDDPRPRRACTAPTTSPARC